MYQPKIKLMFFFLKNARTETYICENSKYCFKNLILEVINTSFVPVFFKKNCRTIFLTKLKKFKVETTVVLVNNFSVKFFQQFFALIFFKKLGISPPRCKFLVESLISNERKLGLIYSALKNTF